MMSIQSNHEREACAPHTCDRCGRCGSESQLGARRVPMLLMPAGTMESLRAVEMHALALSDDDVEVFDNPAQLGLNF